MVASCFSNDDDGLMLAPVAVPEVVALAGEYVRAHAGVTISDSGFGSCSLTAPRDCFSLYVEAFAVFVVATDEPPLKLTPLFVLPSGFGGGVGGRLLLVRLGPHCCIPNIAPD